jgi:hypothetical protein
MQQGPSRARRHEVVPEPSGRGSPPGTSLEHGQNDQDHAVPLVRRLDYFLMTGDTGYNAGERRGSGELDPHVRAVEMRRERERRLSIQEEARLKASPLRKLGRSLYSSLGGRRSGTAGPRPHAARRQSHDIGARRHSQDFTDLKTAPQLATGTPINGARRRSHDFSGEKINGNARRNSGFSLNGNARRNSGFSHSQQRPLHQLNGLSPNGRQRPMHAVSDIATNGKQSQAAIFRPPPYEEAINRYEREQLAGELRARGGRPKAVNGLQHDGHSLQHEFLHSSTGGSSPKRSWFRKGQRQAAYAT